MHQARQYLRSNPSPGKRTQDVWNTYCHKWFAMEELPDYKKIKGIQDRSFVINMVVGNVDYNIKDIIGRKSGDVNHKKLYDELMDVRKLLLAFRLVHYNDEIPDVKLNIIHRNEELTKPLLRLFSYRNDAPNALERIRLALSKFVLGRNEAKRNSIESKLLQAVKNLIKIREEHPKQFDGLDSLEFTNDMVFGHVRELMEGEDIPGKSGSFYSVEYGTISHNRITRLYRSKLKAEGFVKRIRDTTKRVLKFSQEWLDRLELYYQVPNEIEFVTDVTHVTDPSVVSEGNNEENHEGNEGEKEVDTTPTSVTSVTSVTDLADRMRANKDL